MNISHFCFCDLDCDPLTLKYKLCLDILNVYLHNKNEVSRSRLSKVRAQTGQADIWTDVTEQPHLHMVKIVGNSAIRHLSYFLEIAVSMGVAFLSLHPVYNGSWVMNAVYLVCVSSDRFLVCSEIDLVQSQVTWATMLLSSTLVILRWRAIFGGRSCTIIIQGAHYVTVVAVIETR